MADQYDSFSKLERGEKKGVDYEIRIERRDSPVAIIAPHGGSIEPHTMLIAETIAADSYNFYSFLGLKKRPHSDLHITSTRFDEPNCLDLIASCNIVVAIHGRADKGNPNTTWLGGRDIKLRDSILKALSTAGFGTTIAGLELAGTSTQNICNRGQQKRGVQLEIPPALRDLLQKTPDQRRRFSDAVRSAIEGSITPLPPR